MPKIRARLASTLTVEQLRALQPERSFQRQVISEAERLGWWVKVEPDSRLTRAGWPDLVLLHPEWRRFMLRELKTNAGRVRPAQAWLLRLLRDSGIDAKIWRPADWPIIEAELRGEP